MLRIKKILAWISLVAVGALAACGTYDVGNDPNHVHDLIKYSSRTATCRKEGRLAYWHCDECNRYYLDADATKRVSWEEIVIPKIAHTTVKTDCVSATCTARCPSTPLPVSPLAASTFSWPVFFSISKV